MLLVRLEDGWCIFEGTGEGGRGCGLHGRWRQKWVPEVVVVERGRCRIGVGEEGGGRKGAGREVDGVAWRAFVVVVVVVVSGAVSGDNFLGGAFGVLEKLIEQLEEEWESGAT